MSKLRCCLFALALVSGSSAFAVTGELVASNVSYRAGNDAPARCRLDIRRPCGITGFPTVVWFHGGGLSSGRRHFVGDAGSALDPRIAQVAVGYRLLGPKGDAKSPDDCIDDAAAAVAWTLEHIADYGGDPRRVFVSGGSAGGYLTMMVGMDASRLARYGHRPTEIAGLIPVSGQATTHFAVKQFFGDTRGQYVPQIDRYAPLYHCTTNMPPICTIVGETPWEWKARNEENSLLVASLHALGLRDAWFVEAPYCDHGRVMDAAVPYIRMMCLGMMIRDTKRRQP